MQIKTFGDRLYWQRRMTGLSQKAIAEKLAENGVEIGQSYICMMEADKANPTKDVIVGLAKVYGVSADYLLGLSDEKELA